METVKTEQEGRKAGGLELKGGWPTNLSKQEARWALDLMKDAPRGTMPEHFLRGTLLHTAAVAKARREHEEMPFPGTDGPCLVIYDGFRRLDRRTVEISLGQVEPLLVKARKKKGWTETAVVLETQGPGEMTAQFCLEKSRKRRE